MAEWTGRTLGKVRIEKLIARGGMAEVYLGTHLTLGRPVAVKMLLSYLEDQPETQMRFQREAHVVAGLRHPNIVQIFDFDVLDGQPYIVMEYLPGPSLATYLKSLHERGQRLSLPVVAHLTYSLASALEYAHAQGVVHRDVKPANIILHSKRGPVNLYGPLPDDLEPILTDFGLSRLVDAQYRTASGMVAGTPAYMSPEQARGEQVDSRSDIYSLGIVLYEMLAGRVPFEAESTMGVLLKHINDTPPPIPNLPPAQQAVIDRALEKDPRRRYQTPGQLAEEFANAIGATLPNISTPSSASLKTLPPTLTPAPVSRGLSDRIPFWAVLVGLIVFLMVGGSLWLGNLTTTAPPATPRNPSQPAAGNTAASVDTSIPDATGTAQAVADSLEPAGVLTFSDLGTGKVNQALLDVSALQPPATGKHYEAWLVAGEARRSIGILPVDSSGKGQITYIDSQNRNILGLYDTLEITLEPDPDDSPNPSGDVVYSSVFPPGALKHVRHLLVSFSDTPGQIGLIDGLLATTQAIEDSAHAMLAAYGANNEKETRKQAEAIFNAIVGKEDPNYGDLDGDGQVTDAGDGYGLLLNGDHVGYTEGVFAHAGYAANTDDSNENIQVHAAHVQISAKNVEGWAPQLRDLAQTVAHGSFGPELQDPINQAVSLADRMLNGVDINGNEQIQPIPGEGGAKTAYQHAYYLGTMSVYLGPHMMAPITTPIPTSEALEDYTPTP